MHLTPLCISLCISQASDHHDEERWRRLGPSSEAEASALLSRIAAALEVIGRS